MGAIQQALDEEMPFRWLGRTYLFGHSLWKVTESEDALSQNDLKLLFLEVVDKERKKFERLKNKFSGVAGQKLENKRECIAEEVRIFVWRRDEGKCVKCGSQQNLEFDHIIPVAKGGGKTARNIQILCEKCNREKSTNI
ncbi:MAG: HNH endonuclease [Candidatus Omnitrophica bacterium]|nr:HNH endonuclease [Candidatus Omnitrophota bacterium]